MTVQFARFKSAERWKLGKVPCRGKMATTSLFDDGTPSQKGVGSPSPEVGMTDPQLMWIIKQVTRNEPKNNEFKEKAREAYRSGTASNSPKKMKSS